VANILDDTTLKAVIGILAAVVAPLAGTVGAFLSRTSIQQKQQEIDFKKKRLELIEATVKVGQLMSDSLKCRLDLSSIETEFLRIVVSLPEPEPMDQRRTFELSPLHIRIFRLPRPGTLAGWIASSIFYVFLCYLLIFIGWYGIEGLPDDDQGLILVLIVAVACLFIIGCARYLAIHWAWAAAERERDRYNRESALIQAAAVSREGSA
jgi:hypothetical protein